VMARFLILLLDRVDSSFSSFAKQELNQLHVYGNNFLFSVKDHLAGRGTLQVLKNISQISYYTKRRRLLIASRD